MKYITNINMIVPKLLEHTHTLCDDTISSLPPHFRL